VNSQNNGHSSVEDPIVIHEVLLHDVLAGVWCAMIARRILWSIFFPETLHTNMLHRLTPPFEHLSGVREPVPFCSKMVQQLTIFCIVQ
jgi:hypothetical protein